VQFHFDLAELRPDVALFRVKIGPTGFARGALLGTSSLARMKPSATLINTARGPIVDQATLIEALAQSRLLVQVSMCSTWSRGGDHAVLSIVG